MKIVTFFQVFGNEIILQSFVFTFYMDVTTVQIISDEFYSIYMKVPTVNMFQEIASDFLKNRIFKNVKMQSMANIYE